MRITHTVVAIICDGCGVGQSAPGIEVVHESVDGLTWTVYRTGEGKINPAAEFHACSTKCRRTVTQHMIAFPAWAASRGER